MPNSADIIRECDIKGSEYFKHLKRKHKFCTLKSIHNSLQNNKISLHPMQDIIDHIEHDVLSINSARKPAVNRLKETWAYPRYLWTSGRNRKIAYDNHHDSLTRVWAGKG